MLTLTSPIDINVSTTGVLVLVTKDSFVSLVTNLNNEAKTMFVNSDVSINWLSGGFSIAP